MSHDLKRPPQTWDYPLHSSIVMCPADVSYNKISFDQQPIHSPISQAKSDLLFMASHLP